MCPDTNIQVSRREKITSLLSVAGYKPKLTIILIILGIFAAIFEGVGIGFILPIVELIQATGDPTANAEGIFLLFAKLYNFFNIPLQLSTVVVGVSLVLVIRYVLTFSGVWFRESLRTYYIRDLQKRAFRRALNAEIAYYDQEGTDDILNAIITQTKYAGRAIQNGVTLFQQLFLAFIYLAIAFIISPFLTVFTIVGIGGIMYLLRNLVQPGYDLGEKVAEANEDRQEVVQAGTQGIRDSRIFGLTNQLYDNFVETVNEYTRSVIELRRNEAALNNFNNLTISIVVFVLIYLSVAYANLSVSSLGIFLFAVFRLGPKASRLNRIIYKIENDLPHLIRTQQFIDELEAHSEPTDGDRDAPNEIREVAFRDVSFSYDGSEQVLDQVSFMIENDEFVAFVGQSGAGKSTIASLLARMYNPDEGEITANSNPVHKMDIEEWRNKIAIVRQDPYIFNETLRFNLTIGDQNATKSELESVCEISKVDEFLLDLPNGFDTELGESGVKLSGGQRQRVALARALLKDAELLILDEATSDLDTNLESEVQKAIEQMNRNYMIITIAHRLSTVKNADRIYTIKNGRVTECGTHNDLLKKNGKYSELYAVQSRNE